MKQGKGNKKAKIIGTTAGLSGLYGAAMGGLTNGIGAATIHDGGTIHTTVWNAHNYAGLAGQTLNNYAAVDGTVTGGGLGLAAGALAAGAYVAHKNRKNQNLGKQFD